MQEATNLQSMALNIKRIGITAAWTIPGASQEPVLSRSKPKNKPIGNNIKYQGNISGLNLTLWIKLKKMAVIIFAWLKMPNLPFQCCSRTPWITPRKASSSDNPIKTMFVRRHINALLINTSAWISYERYCEKQVITKMIVSSAHRR